MLTTQGGYEDRFLTYAHKVFSIASGCSCDSDVSWPGYIGRGYAKSKVLIVASIHNAPVLESSGIFDIIPIVQKFRRDQSASVAREYVSAVQDAYVNAIPRWARYKNKQGKSINNTVWSRILKLLALMDVSTEGIAFTNLAKCGLPSGTSSISEMRRIKQHNAATPLRELIESLEPRYVLIAKEAKGLPELLGLNGLTPAPRYCKNLTFNSSGVLFAKWRTEDAHKYKSAARGPITATIPVGSETNLFA